jgi:hypothetical protein
VNGTRTVRISSPGCTKGMLRNVAQDRSCATKAYVCFRFKADMWSKIAEEMTLPWRAAEAMHWQMGELEMARRAGVTAFSLSNNQAMPPTSMPPRSHMRHSSAAPRMRGDSASRTGPPQLPSLAELTAGLPAYATQPGTPYHDLRSPPQIPTQMYNYHQAHQAPRR